MKLFSEAAKITLPMAAAKLFDLVTIPLNYTPSVTLSLSLTSYWESHFFRASQGNQHHTHMGFMDYIRCVMTKLLFLTRELFITRNLPDGFAVE